MADGAENRWELVAMNDTSWRRGIWMKLDADGTLYLKSGRGGNDCGCTIPAPYGAEVEGVLAVGAWMVQSHIMMCDHGVPMYHEQFQQRGCMQRSGWNDHEAVTYKQWVGCYRHSYDEFSDHLEAGW